MHALREIELTVEPGELVAVMGPSGSGKSTLLTIAGSLEEPTEGEVTVGDRALSRLSRGERAALRRRSIGYVFQDFNLLAGLTAAENVSLPLELDGLSAGAARGPRRWPHWIGSAWPSGPTGSPTSCPVASGSGWPSPGQSSGTGTCCSPTNRPERWIRSTARR